MTFDAVKNASCTFCRPSRIVWVILANRAADACARKLEVAAFTYTYCDW
jgi:hypothetical protein